MLEFKAETTIAAAADTIWAHLVDVGSWPAWDPTCERVEGQVALGTKLKVYSTLAPGRAFKVTVTELDEPTRMVWTGGMPLGLFTGVRIFALARTPDGDIHFLLHETFDGIVLPLIAKSLPDMTQAFEGFCAGLKERAEAAG